MNKEKTFSDPILLKEKYKNQKFHLFKITPELEAIKKQIMDLNIPDLEKNELFNEISKLPINFRQDLIQKIIEEDSINVKKFQIENLIGEFEEMEKQQNWKDALNILEIILELAENQGYQLIFEKLFVKYQEIQDKLE